MIPFRAIIAEWWTRHSPYWRGYRAGLAAQQRTAEAYARTQQHVDPDLGFRADRPAVTKPRTRYPWHDIRTWWGV